MGGGSFEAQNMLLYSKAFKVNINIGHYVSCTEEATTLVCMTVNKMIDRSTVNVHKHVES